MAGSAPVRTISDVLADIRRLRKSYDRITDELEVAKDKWLSSQDAQMIIGRELSTAHEELKRLAEHGDE